MKVLFVLNSVYSKGNGLAASARTSVRFLKEAGVDVRVLSMRNTDQDGPQPDYPLEPFYFPFFQRLIVHQGYSFASSDMKVLEEAVKWADVIHFEEAFVLEWRVSKLAVKYGKPCVATYHMHPENIFSSLGMGNVRFINDWFLNIAKRVVYDKCKVIQCPSMNVLRRLQKSGFKSRLEVIPNGLVMDGICISSVPQTSPYLIACIGRLSNEKDQYTLIRAMKHCRHRGEIQLYFAGQGPCRKRMMRMAHALYVNGTVGYDPEFNFLSADELKELAGKCYLTVHCAVYEVEGLSLPEALRHGAVPIIADGDLTATSQFALDGRSIFPAGDEKALAERIDWWIEHPQERATMSPRYAESVYKYDIHASIDKLVAMYKSIS